MIYGTKAADKETIESWYEALKANARDSALQSQQSSESAATSSISRSIYTLASIRCTIKLSGELNDFGFSLIQSLSRAIDDRHLFFNVLPGSSCFYIVDTFNDDVQ